jgi:secretion/DNA translocation related TadE-like protein
MTSERGSISLVAAGAIVVALVLSLGVADVGRVLVAQARARTAADAAALAAAQELAIPGTATPEDEALEYADRNGGDLVSCTCAAGSGEAVTEVLVRVGPLFLGPDDRWVEARARAVVDVTPPA